ncbi:MAG TPA: hypothetical protein VFM82_10785 [Flavobacteriaceae bacterium]|nr:hypothetical protein [Flavobacteriaceae bacterium]
MKTLILHTVLAFTAALGSMGSVFAQEKIEKLNENFEVNQNVSIDVDAKYTTFIFKTWNKNQVKVEAYFEGKNYSDEEKSQLLANWDLKVLGNSKTIQISSQTGGMGIPRGPMASFVPSIIGDSLFFDRHNFQMMIGPMMEDIARMEPILPASFYRNLGELHFDHEAFKKEGEAYLKSYEKQIREKFGQDYAQKMQKWGEQIQREMQAHHEDLMQRREMMQENREKQMQQREKQLQMRREEMDERMKKLAENNPNASYSKTVTTLPNGGKRIEMQFSNAATWNSENEEKRTVVVSVPKNATLQLNIRHGKLQLEDAVSNINAQLTHTGFTASEIDGEETKIQVSYAPVNIELWKYGVLNLSYVKDCTIETANSIKLTSNSSNVIIDELQQFGILSGSFGELSIAQVGQKFQTLQIHLENSDLNLTLPESAFDFSYNGSHSNIDLPASLKVNTQNNYGNAFMEGYYLSQKNSSKISIDANFSEVKLKE